MNFDLTRSEQMALDRGEEIGAILQEKDKDPELFQRELWDTIAGLDLFKRLVPVKLGGIQCTALEITFMLEGIARHWENTGMLFAACAQLFACMVPLIQFGSKEQQAGILPGVMEGRTILANLMTEPDSGSDCFNINTRVIGQDDTVYFISGNKCFITNAPLADYFISYVNTNPDHGYFGISCIVIPAKSEGISVSKPLKKMGLHGSLLANVHLDKCKVSKAFLIGREGSGASIFNVSMQWERTCLFAIYLGLLERQLEKIIHYVKNHRGSNKKKSQSQGIENLVVDMKINIESARLLLYRAAYFLGKKENNELFSCLSKWYISQKAVENSIMAVQLHGEYGCRKESGMDQMFRDCVPAKIFSGTNEIQKNMIARMLGL